jgi:hypothetical protein
MDAAQNTDAIRLCRDLYYQVVHSLRVALPPPARAGVEDLVRRDNAAIAQVAAMLPGNAEEAGLAAIVVAANAHGLDCLRLARECQGDIALAVRCTAQSASMMRQSRGARILLLRLQTDRQRRDADNAARELAGWTEQSALGLMADALEPIDVRPEPVVEKLPAEHATATGLAAESHRENTETMLRLDDEAAVTWGHLPAA